MRRWLLLWVMGVPVACATAPVARKPAPTSQAQSTQSAAAAPEPATSHDNEPELRAPLAPLDDPEARMADAVYAARIAQDPHDPRGYLARAMVRQRAGDVMGAARLYRMAEAVDRGFGPAWSNHGALLLEAGHVDEAVTLLMRGAAESPDHAPIFANLAAGLSMQERHEEAIAAAETAVELDEKDADLRRNHAAILYKAKRYAETERVLKRALAEFPDEAPDFLFRLSELHVATGEEDRAIDELERVSRLVPDFPLPYLRRAALLGRRNDLDATLHVLSEGLKHNPQDEELRKFFTAAMALRMQRDLEDGQARIAENARDVQAYLQVARVYQLGHDYDAAYEVLHTGVTENPDSGALWSQLGTVELFRSNEREALQAWRKAITLDRTQGTALNNCAYLLVTAKDEQLRNRDEALVLVHRALDLEPQNTSYLDTLAEVHFARGDVAEAQKTIRVALELSPDDEALQAQARRFDEALAERQKGDP
ncbi:MAG: tetratricopeptide repeat protein [Myxococcota bacterium]